MRKGELVVRGVFRGTLGRAGTAQEAAAQMSGVEYLEFRTEVTIGDWLHHARGSGSTIHPYG